MTNPDEPVLVVDDVWKTYRKGKTASAGVSFTVSTGQVVGFLGHNGAGKTTLVNQIVGLLLPDSGRITLAGVDAIAHPQLARELASVQAQANVPITGMSPRTAIELVARVRQVPKKEARHRTQQLLEELDLLEWADMPAQKISGGVARLTAFAMAVVAPAHLVILDEPTNDVDPVRRRLLFEKVRRLADSGPAVLLVTHNVREVESVVDDVVIVNSGTVVAAGTPADLTADLTDHLTLELALAGPTSPPAYALPLHATATRASFAIPAERAIDVVEWAHSRQAAGGIDQYSLSAPSLEDAYIRIVGHETSAAQESLAS